MRLLSKNLVIKNFCAVVDPEDKRVIDTNILMQRRLEELAERSLQQQADGDGFVAGLYAEEIQEPLTDENGEPVFGGNVIKAGEDASAVLERAREEAAGLVEDARMQAEEIRRSTLAEAEAEKERIIAEARNQGFQEGQLKAHKELQKEMDRFTERERQLEAFYEEQLKNMEPQLVETITDIYSHIFQVELSSYKEILVHLISTTLRKLEGGREFVVHVSKEDYPYVNMQKRQLIAGAVAGNGRVDVVEDLTLSKNECMIETEGGIFDCGLGTQLMELQQKLTLLSWSKEE